jgi:hypothetical protein
MARAATIIARRTRKQKKKNRTPASDRCAGAGASVPLFSQTAVGWLMNGMRPAGKNRERDGRAIATLDFNVH